MMHLSRRLIISSLLLVASCLVIGLWSLRSGVVTLETQQIIAALLGDAPRSITLVVTEWRLPRVLMALLIGAALGVSGAIFQSLMRNPLGSPDVMGFNTGAGAVCWWQWCCSDSILPRSRWRPCSVGS